MPRPTTTVQAVCLGDELQDVSDEERINLRVEQELVKDEQVEKWEIEIEASNPLQTNSKATPMLIVSTIFLAFSLGFEWDAIPDDQTAAT
jgi:hypothetical protein